MGNCLVTKLKAAVNNDKLPYLGYIKVTLYSISTSNRFFYLPNYDNKESGKVVSGKVYSDSGQTTQITELPKGHARKEIYVEDGSEATVLFNKENGNITVLGREASLVSGTNPSVCSWYVNLEDLYESSVLAVNLYMAEYINGSRDLENLFVAWFRRFKRDDNRNFEGITQAYLSVISNRSSSVFEGQILFHFNGQNFYNKYLCISTDIDNNTFDLYKTATSVTGGYTLSDKVATYNNTTGEWTYFE